MAIAQHYTDESHHTSDRTDGNRDTSHTMIYSDNEDRNPLLESPIAIGVLLVVVALFTGITAWVIVMAFNQPQTAVKPEEPAIFTNPEIPSPNIPTLPNPPTTTQPTTGNQEEKQGSKEAGEQSGRGNPMAVVAPEQGSGGAEGMGRNTSPLDQSTSAPTEKPTPTPEPKPQTYNQPVEISLGVPQVLQGNLKAKETINYKIQGQAGEELLTFVSGQGVLMKLIGPNGEMMENVSMWEGALPSTGEYTIALSPLPDLPGSNYELQIELKPGRPAAPPAATEPDRPSPATPSATEPDRPSPVTPSPVPIEVAPNPQPTETEAENLPPSGSSQVISFPGGAGTQQIYDTTSPDQIKTYFVTVEEGKTLKAETLLGAVSLDIRDPNGNLLNNAERVVFWQGQATMTGEYQIDVIAPEALNFSLEVQVRD